MASMAVVEVLGAMPSGQASSSLPMLRTMSLNLAPRDSTRPVIKITSQPIFFSCGISLTSSPDSPLLDIARMTSSG